MNSTVVPQPPPNPLALLPNPFTPMAFLPPDIAVQYTINTYVIIAITTASLQIWDTISHLLDDYHLVRRNKVHLAMIVYFTSRAATLVYMLGYTVLSTAPIGRCALFNKIINFFYLISVPSSELLFFLHVRAVFIQNKPAVYFFMFLWICTMLSTMTPIIAAYTVAPFINIGPTRYCVGTLVPAYVGASAIVPLINDSILFFSLAWRLQSNVYIGADEKRQFKGVVAGTYLSRLQRALFQNGQAYFLSTVVLNISTVGLVYAKSIPVSYRDIMGFPCIVIMNIMASRIYRNVNSGAFHLKPNVSSNVSDTLRFNSNGHQVEEISLNQTASGNSVPVDTRFVGGLVRGKSSQSFNFVGDYGV
ncbi:hypothetical protein HYPSUDRAFT_1063858 [Hypholoma sublateritium FD-334 SS-4]|uniref:Uncharacterized protein n=1 Tax=Hypholoma sublateritium (strain FD-334 SS-4) TaxID=945553 RepID=A0A0D2PDR2_HYPSF|nr:hypothetical protein HYPSUDRAFT_1063858 [Hypholoma sublateritium FD-334 SS-4]